MEKLISLTIDGARVTALEGTTILDAAQQVGIYIAHLCSHPDLPPVQGLKPAKVVYRDGIPIENKKTGLQEYEGCQLCVVEVEGEEELKRACCTEIAQGMVAHTDTQRVQDFRQERLKFIVAQHPHICLTCAQREGCARFPCSMNIPENERCCVKFGKCELQKIAEYVGIKPDTPRYIFEDLPLIKDDPLFQRDYNLCIGCARCIRVCREVRGVGALDFVFDEEGRVIVGTVDANLKESECKFCTACVEVCPTGALLDKKEFKEAPCKVTCPAGIDVPRYVHLIAEGEFAKAAAVIREKVPFPKVLGYICPHDCEPQCRRGEVNEPIAIRALKRFAAEHDDGSWKERVKNAPATGRKVAIIGSGPAGLTASYYLAKLGHAVTIFESGSKSGGMMREGIPRFLLPENVLDEEIDEILSLGIELKLNSPIQNVRQLLDDGYDAVLIAIGLQIGRRLPIPGIDLDQVLIGLDFLRDVSRGKEVQLGKNVLVLGGGGVAWDVARVARRLGIPQVSMACLESRETLPAYPSDVNEGEEEGIKLFPSHSFKRIVEKDGHVSGVECVDVKWMEFDKEGKLHLETIPNSEHVLEADTVIFAIGQGIEQAIIENNEIELTKRGLVKASSETLETNLEGVFVAGDAVSGPASVIEAINSGRKVASSIDIYLGGKGAIAESLTEEGKISPYLGKEEGFAANRRIEATLLPATERIQSFDEVEPTLTEEEAISEAKRCLRCDIRFLLSKPILPPKEKLWVEFTSENIADVPEIEGVYQFLNEQENVIYIKGAMNLHRELEEELGIQEKAKYFMYQVEPMFTKRESELLQQYIAAHGEMPEGNRELEELF
jgi:NADPH-dependent glutamate synthase beta subunit-like oxidoreductase